VLTETNRQRPREGRPGHCPDGAGADLALVQGVMQGAPGADERLLDRLRCLARFLTAMNLRQGSVLDSHEIADLVQDTLVVVWRKLDRFHGPDGLEAWVLRIARFEFQNSLRRKYRRAQHEAPIEAGAEVVAPGDVPKATLDRSAVDQALEEINGDAARTVRLKHYGGLTFEEIAARMGCSPNTAKTRYYRALTRLAATLESSQE